MGRARRAALAPAGAAVQLAPARKACPPRTAPAAFGSRRAPPPAPARSPCAATRPLPRIGHRPRRPKRAIARGWRGNLGSGSSSDGTSAAASRTSGPNRRRYATSSAPSDSGPSTRSLLTPSKASGSGLSARHMTCAPARWSSWAEATTVLRLAAGFENTRVSGFPRIATPCPGTLEKVPP